MRTGISVDLRTNDGVVLADQLMQEGHGSPADAYFTENSPELEHLFENGLLARSPRSVLGQVPARYRSPGHLGRRGPARQRPCLQPEADFALAVAKLDPRLRGSRWKGKVAIAPLDSDFPPVVGAVIATPARAPRAAGSTR